MTIEVLVTGAAGFIGKNLVQYLVSQGKYVRCLVQKEEEAALFRSRFTETIVGDLHNIESLESAMQGIKCVYHLAAQVRPRGWIAPQRQYNFYMKDNYEGTVNVATVALRHSIQKFIYFSSIAAGGIGSDLTELAPSLPLTDYGKSKLQSEQYLHEMYRDHHLPVIIVRPGFVYGKESIGLQMLCSWIEHGVIPLVEGGYPSMPMCYVNDLVKIVTLLETAHERNGEIYYIAERTYTIREFVECLKAYVGKRKLFYVYIPRFIFRWYCIGKEIIERMCNMKVMPFKIELSLPLCEQLGTRWSCNCDKLFTHLKVKPQTVLLQGIKDIFTVSS